MTLNEHRITSTNPDKSGKWKRVIPALPIETWLAGKGSILPNFGAGLEIGFSALKNWFSELNLPGRSLSLLSC